MSVLHERISIRYPPFTGCRDEAISIVIDDTLLRKGFRIS